jgi:mono/diheme cytochrome c family protein
MDPGPTPVSFANQIQPIFDAECVQCHGESAFGGLDLRPDSSHGNLVGVESNGYAPAVLVTPGEPATSVLYGKVSNSGQFGTVMPPPPNDELTATQLGLIERWIEEGANP